jgi:Minichromosome loss protein, Mcl1, middle region
VNLNSGEAALAVAVGQGWSAVATSHGLLRLFSSTGIPLALLCLKGSVITMIGYAHQLAGMAFFKKLSILREAFGTTFRLRKDHILALAEHAFHSLSHVTRQSIP